MSGSTGSAGRAPVDTGPDVGAGAPGPAGRRPLAVVGMGAVFPGAHSPEEFWQLRLRDEAMFTEPDDRWDVETTFSPDPDAEDRAYVRRSGFIRGFRPQLDGVAHRGWSPTGPRAEYTALWLRKALLQALDGVRRRDDDRVSCTLGYCATGSQHLEESLVAAGLARRLGRRLASEVGHERAAELVGALGRCLPLSRPEPWQYLPHVVVQHAVDGILPPRVTVVDTACSSSLYALDAAVRDLLAGRADLAVCGGAYALTPCHPVVFAKIQALSRTERVRALDHEQDGTLFADGAGIIVLKTVERAEADGDRVLGYIAGVGTSSDGKGKAIYAPNAKGQRLAVSRAQRAAGLRPDMVQWVAAHATGTPAGDITEIRVLQDLLGETSGPCYVTSNKSQIGHASMAAGVASLIEVLLGLEHSTVPPQQQLDRPPEAFSEPSSRLVVPDTPRPWPADPARPRAAGVSSFGFGGTNAHVIVTDQPLRWSPSASAVPGPPSEPIAVVGWSSCLPGQMADDEIAAWLRGDGPVPPARFDDEFPMPQLSGFRIPPKTRRLIDRCQVMILECTARLQPALEQVWSDRHETTGVLVGHMGPTRVATLYAARCYLSRFEQLVGAREELRADPALRRAFAEFRDEIRELAPAGSTYTLPAGLTNTIASRVANYFDFNGVNMAVDTGLNSTLSAVEAASAYLRSGELEIALVCGVNGNTLDELTDVLIGNGSPMREVELAEGAFMLALTTERGARRHGLQVLGLFHDNGSPDTPAAATVVDSTAIAGRRSYLGGEAARTLVQTLVGRPGVTSVQCRDPLSGRTDELVVEVPTSDAGGVPSAGPGGGQLERLVARHVVRLESRPAPADAAPDVVTKGTVVLTDDRAIAERLRTVAGTVCCVDDEIENLLRATDHPVTGLLVVTSLAVGAEPGTVGGDGDLGIMLERRLRLHDATFQALRVLHQQLAEVGGSFQVLLLEAVPDGAVHPHSGLFTGLVRAASWELPNCRTTGVLLTTNDLLKGLVWLGRDTHLMEPGAVVVYTASGRHVPVAYEEPVEVSANPVLGQRPVVVASGGARGITAEALVALAEQTRAELWVLGMNDLDNFPDWVYEGTDEEFTVRGRDFVKEYLATHPDQPPVAARRQLTRMRDARQARANLRRMARHSGGDRVRYLACDVTDGPGVAAAIDRIVEISGGIDLLVHGAGVNQAAALGRKELTDFRRVRDVKVRGYANLKRALRGRAPRLWCNFGSLVGYAGQPGELDYTAGNAFLASAAGYVTWAGAASECTISWPLWRSVGLAADPLTQRFMDRERSSDAVDTAEGVAHFLAEVGGGWADPEVLFLSAGQRAALEQRHPGRFRAAADVAVVPAGPSASDRGPMVDSSYGALPSQTAASLSGGAAEVAEDEAGTTPPGRDRVASAAVDSRHDC